MITEPTLLNATKNFNELTALRIFVEACEQWNVENKNFRYDITIKNMYFDFGQDWMYTGLLTTDTEEEGSLNTWQSLNPKEWKELVNSDSVSQIVDMAWKYMDKLAQRK